MKGFGLDTFIFTLIAGFFIWRYFIKSSETSKRTKPARKKSLNEALKSSYSRRQQIHQSHKSPQHMPVEFKDFSAEDIDYEMPPSPETAIPRHNKNAKDVNRMRRHDWGLRNRSDFISARSLIVFFAGLFIVMWVL